MKTIKSLVAAVVGYFKSGKAEQAFNTVAALVPKALPIVEAIAAATPNKTIAEIALAYAKYGMPMTAELAAAPADKRGYALLDLAAQVLAAEAPGVATNILHAAVQLAVTGSKAA